MKKALSLFLAMLMLISVFSISTVAATTPVITEASAGYFGATLKWSADVGAAGYGVYRFDSAESSPVLIADVNTTSYIDKTVAYGGTYKYAIASKNVDGSFEPVSINNAKLVEYNRVQVRTVYSNYNGVNLVWKATPASQNGYRIYRSVNNARFETLADVKGTSYVDADVAYGTHYEYHIVSLGTNLEYAESLQTATPLKVNYNLVDLKVPTATNTSIDLVWGKIDGAAGYEIYRKSNKVYKDGTVDKGAKIGETTDVCKFSDRNLEEGLTYSYCVIVKGSGATPDYANGRVVKYTTVKFFKHVNQFDGLLLEWAPVENAVKYYLKKNGEIIEELDTPSYLDKNVKNGVAYKYDLTIQFENGVLANFDYSTLVNPKNYKDPLEYTNGLLYVAPTCSRIVEIDGQLYHVFEPSIDKKVIDRYATVYEIGYMHYICAECGAHSNKKVIAQLAPKTPEIISLHNTNLGTKLTWEAVDGADLYVVYRRATINGVSGSWQMIRTFSSSITTCYDNTVKTGGYYKYAVKALRRTADVNSLVVVKNANGTKSLFWPTNFARANAYYIYRKDDVTINEWTLLALMSDDYSFYSNTSKKYLTYFNDGQPNPDAAGYFVKGVLVSDLGAGRVIRAVKTPVGHTVKNNVTGILFSWNKVEGATSYRVYRKVASDRYWTFMGYTTKTFYPDYDVESGLTYVYTVRAVSNGHFSDYVRDGVSIYRLDAPKLVSAKSTREGIAVEFEHVNGASKYFVYRREPGKAWQMIGQVDDLKSYTYLDRFAVKGVTYIYTIKAVDGKTMSSYYSGISCKDIY